MKSEDDKILDDFLRNNLDNYKADPPPGLWQVIRQQLPIKGPGKFYFPNSGPGIVASVTSGIVILGLTAYYFSGKMDSKPVVQQSEKNNIAQLTTKDQVKADANDSDTIEIVSVAPVHGGLSYNTKTNLLKVHKTGLVKTTQASDIQPEEVQINSKNIDLSPSAIQAQTSESKEVTPPASTHELKRIPTPVAITETVSKPESLDKGQTAIIPGRNALTETKSEQVLSEEIRTTSNAALITDHPVSKDEALLKYFSIPSRRSQLLILGGGFGSTFNLSPKESEFPPLEELLKRDALKNIDYARVKNNWAIGASFMPEWLISSKDLHNSDKRFSGGLSLRWKNGPFIIESGFGIQYEQSTNTYQLHYRQVLGVYQSLDSIGFTEDPYTHNEIPHYYYSPDSVYDPNIRTMSKTATNYYTFIQIPVLFGINKDFRRSSLYLEGGPVFNYLFTQYLNIPYIDDPDKTYRQLIDENPVRLKTNWQWMISLGYGYHLTDKFELTLESVLRGYIDSPYERLKSPNVNPLYGGFRLGGLWSF